MSGRLFPGIYRVAGEQRPRGISFGEIITVATNDAHRDSDNVRSINVAHIFGWLLNSSAFPSTTVR